MIIKASFPVHVPSQVGSTFSFLVLRSFCNMVMRTCSYTTITPGASQAQLTTAVNKAIILKF